MPDAPGVFNFIERLFEFAVLNCFYNRDPVFPKVVTKQFAFAGIVLQVMAENNGSFARSRHGAIVFKTVVATPPCHTPSAGLLLCQRPELF